MPLGLFALGLVAVKAANLKFGRDEFPKTDFSRHAVPLEEILDVVNRDQIPAIDNPRLVPIEATHDIGDREPVITLALGGEVRAYPLRILTWHEIVNDVIAGVPVAVTYCPLCNSGIVFDRRVDGAVLDFGVSGRLRNSDMVMYDRQTESWWQQFLGEAIVGHYTGTRLEMIPIRMESFARFRERAPDGLVLVPTSPGMRQYGINPYESYDQRSAPYSRTFLGGLPTDIAPLARVVAVGRDAWSLDYLRAKGRVRRDDLVITWEPGQASALGSLFIADGEDVGNVVVQRVVDDQLVDVLHDITFAFAFRAFYPDAPIRTQ